MVGKHSPNDLDVFWQHFGSYMVVREERVLNALKHGDRLTSCLRFWLVVDFSRLHDGFLGVGPNTAVFHCGSGNSFACTGSD